MIELGVGFHPELTGRENVFLNAAIHGLTGPETEAIYGGIVELLRARALHRRARSRTTRRACTCGWALRLRRISIRTSCSSTRSSPSATPTSSSAASTRCKGFMEQGKTIIFVSHSPDAVRTICRRVCVLDQGELAFDGDVEGGLAFYDALLHRDQHGHPVPARPERGRPRRSRCSNRRPSPTRQATTRELDVRVSPAGRSASHGIVSFTSAMPAWRSRSTGARFSTSTTTSGSSTTQSLFELGAEAGRVRLRRGRFGVSRRSRSTPSRAASPASFAGCSRPAASTPPGSRIPIPANFEPIVQPSGVTTYPDREPYHYPFALIANVCDAVGATVERVPGTGHPGGESLLLISRRH